VRICEHLCTSEEALSCHVNSFLNVIGLLCLAGALALPGVARAQWLPANPVINVQKQPDGVLLQLQRGYLRFPRMHGVHRPRDLFPGKPVFPEHTDFLVVKTEWPHAGFTLESTDPKTVTLSTARLKIVIDRETAPCNSLT